MTPEDIAVTVSADVETTACPLCGGGRTTGRHYDFDPYAVVRCADCGLSYLSPRMPEALLTLRYAQDYFAGETGGYEDYTLQEQALRVTFRRLIEHLGRRNLTGGALLEVGCGYGYLLDEARGAFERRCGSELSPHAVERAQQRADEVYAGSIDQIPADERFDCIMSTQVIEHVYDPVDFLRALSGHLNPGGSMVLTTPNMASVLRTLMGRSWPSFKVPEHVALYDERTLALLLRSVGFQDVSALPHPHAFPLALIASKFGLRSFPWIGHWNLWVPTTAIAAYGVRPS